MILSRQRILFLLLALAVSSTKSVPFEDVSSRITDPFENGEFPVSHTIYRQVTSLSLDTNLDVYAPNSTGNFPVFYFVTGFGG